MFSLNMVIGVDGGGVVVVAHKILVTAKFTFPFLDLTGTGTWPVACQELAKSPRLESDLFIIISRAKAFSLLLYASLKPICI